MTDFDDLSSVQSDTRDETPELSDAERRYFENGGNISATDEARLNQEHGLSQPQPQEHDRHNAEVRASLQRKLDDYYAANRQLADVNARLTERQEMLTEALSPEQPQQDHAWSRPMERPDPNLDIFATQDYDHQRIARLEQMVADAAQQRQWQQHEQAEINYYRQSMDRRAAADPEFHQGYQMWLATRYGELMSRRYPDATPQQIYAAVGQGRIPADLVQKVQAEERQLIRDARQRGVDPADHIEGMMRGRGWQTARERAWRADQQRQANARQHAAEQKAAEDEREWKRSVARRVAAVPGVSFEDALREVLPNRADRMRYRHGSNAYADHGSRRF
jgi:hypothetical protein